MPKPISKQELQTKGVYRKGDFIGQKYEVHGILGEGGFGIVYLVFSHETGEVYALKTFRDEFLAYQKVKDRFYKEAKVWVELGRFPYLVRAFFVDEVLGRLYIAMEYVAPNDAGLNSLDGYLRSKPPDLAQSLRWAIQICQGMEHAVSRGLRAHRDLKPANIMVTQDMTAKITDFGLAGWLAESMASPSPRDHSGSTGQSARTLLGQGLGTPIYMPPEQFDNAAGCDERSDIYSFGVMLYQLATAGRVPFLAPSGPNFFQAMMRLHRDISAPAVDSPLFPIIFRCLQKSPAKRYQVFTEVRKDLELLLQHHTGEQIVQPKTRDLEILEWINKGGSLNRLGRPEEAIRCLDKALELNPHQVIAWNNRGNSLDQLGRYQEAIRCYDKALGLDPAYVYAWNNKGVTLDNLGNRQEAIHSYDKALELNPGYVDAWYNKAISHGGLGRYHEAIHCYDKVLQLDPRHLYAWINKGISIGRLGNRQEAIRCYDKALEVDPSSVDAWYNKGNCFDAMGRDDEAIHCYDKALDLDPRSVDAWFNKGNSFARLARYDEAVNCYDKVLDLDPSSSNAWYNKAVDSEKLGRLHDAADAYRHFLALHPLQYPDQIHYANRRLRALPGA